MTTTAANHEPHNQRSHSPLEGALPKRVTDAPPKMVADRYEVVNVLEGGMALVYLCRDHHTGQLVALKTFKPEFLANRAARDLFLREGTMWVKMGKHPHIVQAHRVERIGDGREVYLVLEWIVQPRDKSNPSLRAWLRPNKPLPLEQSLVFALHVARGMKYAVRKMPGLVHRDMKPENILVGYDGTARVTDFGLASTLSQLGPGDVFTTDGQQKSLGHTQMTQGVAGTPLYMAPEQWEHLPLDPRADIYGFGCIVYEMINGRFAADAARDRSELRKIHLEGKIAPPNPNLPTSVLKFLKGCLQLKKEDRYRNWAEVEAALVVVLTDITGKPVPREKMPDEDETGELLAAGYSYNTMGLSYLDIGKMERAITYFEQAVNIARSVGEQELEGSGLGNLGLVYAALGYSDRAIEFHEEHLQIANELGDLAAQGRALGNLGRAHRQKGEPEQAIPLHNRELNIAQKLSDRMKEAAALHSLGETNRQLGEREEAVKYYQQSLAIARDINDLTRVEKILNSMGEFYLEGGEVKEAMALFKQTLVIAREIGDRVGEGVAMANTAELFYSMKKLDRAIEYAQYALKISEESKHVRNQIKNLLRIGGFRVTNRQFAEAENCFKRALQLAEAIRDPVTQQEAYAQLGRIDMRKKDPVNAGKRFRKALELAEYRDDPVIWRQSYIELANAYREWGDHGGAIKYFKEGLRLAEERADLTDQVWHWLEIVYTQVDKMEQPRTARATLRECAPLIEKLDNPKFTARSLLYHGDVHTKLGNDDEGFKRYGEARDLAKDSNAWGVLAQAYGRIAQYHQKQQGSRWPSPILKAVKAAEQAVDAAKKSKSSRQVAEASLISAEVHIDNGRWSDAHTHASRAFQLYDRLGDAPRKEKAAELLREILKNKDKNTGLLGLWRSN